MNWQPYRLLAVLLVGLTVPATTLWAKKKAHADGQNAQQDQIEVEAHLQLPRTDGPVTSFLMTQHYSRYYVYAEHAASHLVTLIDVTNPEKPVVLADITFPADQKSDQLLAAAGNAALVTQGSGNHAPTPQTPQTIRIFSFVNPLHPKVVQVFRDVIAIRQDIRQGIFFLGESNGDVWILREHFAPDPAVEKRWEHDILGDR
jgi:hypothetical protein